MGKCLEGKLVDLRNEISKWGSLEDKLQYWGVHGT